MNDKIMYVKLDYKKFCITHCLKTDVPVFLDVLVGDVGDVDIRF